MQRYPRDGGQQTPNTGNTPKYHPRMSSRAGASSGTFISNDSGRSSMASAKPSVPVVPAEFDFDWGDDEDDAAMVMASQAVEEAIFSGGNSRGQQRMVEPSPSRREMDLETIRLELALKESNGEYVNREDFMPGGVLGGDIAARENPTKREKERIEELERINAILKSENYSCKGEVTNLRKLLNKQSQDRQKELINRQAREEEKSKKQAEKQDRDAKEFDKTKTELRYIQNQLRASNERCEAYKKQLQRLSQSQSTTNSALNSSRIIPPTVSLNILGFPSRNSFSSREVVQSSPSISDVHTFNMPPSPKKDLSEASVQTEEQHLLSEIEKLEKKWKEELILQKEFIAKLIEQISAATVTELKRTLPKIKIFSELAEKRLVQALNVEGYRYELFFPNNLKVAEYILDRQRQAKEITVPNPMLLKFPSECQDWEGTVGFDEELRALLVNQSNVWRALCFVFNDLHRRISYMRTRGNRNSLYRVNNCAHFFKLLIWGFNLWKYSFKNFWEGWGDKTNARRRNDNFEEIRKSTACILWIGNRIFEVQEIQQELRKLVLMSLTQMTFKTVFDYTTSNFLRLYNVLVHSLTTNMHCSFENVVESFKIVQNLDRKKFCLMYVCTKRNDGKCLAHLFATRGFEFFKDEKSRDRKFELYETYVSFLKSISNWCGVHLDRQCEGEYELQEDDPDDFITSPVFPIPGHSSNSCESRTEESTDKRNVFESSIVSVYGYEDSIVFNDETQNISGLTEVIRLEEPAFKKPKLGNDASNYSTATTENSPEFGSPMDVGEGVPDSHDEWDYTQLQVLESDLHSDNQNPVGGDAQICRKFLDCSLWEEDRRGNAVGYCQCRRHLLETFMRMTEDIIHIWRHVKVLHEYEQRTSGKEIADAEERETELEELVKSLEDERARSASVKGVGSVQIDFEEEAALSSDSAFWSQIICARQTKKVALSPDRISTTLSDAADIMHDAYLSTQLNTRDAFGKEGTNSFRAAAAYLYRYCNDLNFSQETRNIIRQISVDAASSSSGEDDFTNRRVTLLNSEEDNMNPSTPGATSLSSFDSEIYVRPIPKFDPNNEQIVSALPSSLVEELVKFDERKKEAKRRFANRVREKSKTGRSTSKESVKPTSSVTKGAISANIDLNDSNDSDSSEASNDSDDNYVTTEESHDEVDEVSSDTEDSDGEEYKSPKPTRKIRNVSDYNSFCGPSLDDPDGYPETDDELDEDSITVTREELKLELDKHRGVKAGDKGLYVGYKTAKQMCDELQASGGEGHMGANANQAVPGGGHINVDSEEELQQLMKQLTASFGIEGYYDNKSQLWDDSRSKSLPFNI